MLEESSADNDNGFYTTLRYILCISVFLFFIFYFSFFKPAIRRRYWEAQLSDVYKLSVLYKLSVVYISIYLCCISLGGPPSTVKGRHKVSWTVYGRINHSIHNHSFRFSSPSTLSSFRSSHRLCLKAFFFPWTAPALFGSWTTLLLASVTCTKLFLAVSSSRGIPEYHMLMIFSLRLDTCRQCYLCSCVPYLLLCCSFRSRRGCFVVHSTVISVTLRGKQLQHTMTRNSLKLEKTLWRMGGTRRPTPCQMLIRRSRLVRSDRTSRNWPML